MAIKEEEDLGLVGWVRRTGTGTQTSADGDEHEHVCGEDVEVVERFTYIGSDIHVSAGYESEVWVGPGESWIYWIMGCGTAGTCAGGQKSESSGPWCFQSFSVDVILGL